MVGGDSLKMNEYNPLATHGIALLARGIALICFSSAWQPMV